MRAADRAKLRNIASRDHFNKLAFLMSMDILKKGHSKEKYLEKLISY